MKDLAGKVETLDSKYSSEIRKLEKDKESARGEVERIRSKYLPNLEKMRKDAELECSHWKLAFLELAQYEIPKHIIE